MTALVSFDNIKKAWRPSASMFDFTFAALYELYLDKKKAPKICSYLCPVVGLELARQWPRKYQKKPEYGGVEFLPFSRYPSAEKAELLRAAEQFLRDFENNRADPNLIWNRDAKDRILGQLRDLVDLMRREIAESP
jgi:hypothetical protein